MRDLERVTTEYIYDYAGRRVSNWASPNTGNEGRIYWDGQLIAHRSLEALTYFDHEDTLGTQRIRTNYAGYVASSYLSLPWGDGYSATVNNFGGDQDNLHFAGLERDAESDTEHAQFRNYASAQGRWLGPDSYLGSYDLTSPQSMNRYAYALNNPTSFTDPSGLDPICDTDPQTGLLECTSYYPINPPPPTGCVSFGTQGWYLPRMRIDLWLRRASHFSSERRRNHRVCLGTAKDSYSKPAPKGPNHWHYEH